MTATVDTSYESWERWRARWATRFTIPTVALSHSLPTVPLHQLLEFVENPGIDYAYREFYLDCATVADAVGNMDGIIATNADSLRIRMETFSRAIAYFEADPLFNGQGLGLALPPDAWRGISFVDPWQNLREAKVSWEAYDHISHFMRRLYYIAVFEELPILHYLNNDQLRIPILIGVFMVCMYAQVEGEYTDLGDPARLARAEDAALVAQDTEVWQNRFNLIDAETAERLEILADEMDQVLNGNDSDNYWYRPVRFFSMVVRSAETNFQLLHLPPTPNWWWFCEMGHPLPFLQNRNLPPW